MHEQKANFDEELKKPIIWEANNEEVIRGIMLTVSHMREHTEGIPKMLD